MYYAIKNLSKGEHFKLKYTKSKDGNIRANMHITLRFTKEELQELKELMNKYVEKEIDDNKKFYLKNDESISSITQLKEKLPSMSLDVFNHHVNEYRNDFAEWIDHVFNYKALANKIRTVKSKEELIKLLNE